MAIIPPGAPRLVLGISMGISNKEAFICIQILLLVVPPQPEAF